MQVVKKTLTNNESLLKATGKSWDDWKQLLDGINAHELSHKEIAKILYEKYKLDGWWAQGLTVRYEQEIGRRKAGQRADGSFEATASKTIEGDMDYGLKIWSELVNDIKSHNGIDIADAPRVTKTEKWRNWRINFEDGSKVVVGINDKTNGKALIALTHAGLKDEQQLKKWKEYWKSLLNGLNK